MSNTQRIVNAGAKDGPDTEYSGITCELVEELKRECKPICSTFHV